MLVCVVAFVPWCMCEGRKATCRGQFSLSTMCVPEQRVGRLSGLASGALAISPVPDSHLSVYRLAFERLALRSSYPLCGTEKDTLHLVLSAATGVSEQWLKEGRGPV